MTWLRPLPTISPENAPFFAGLREHKFKVPRCLDCGDYNWTPYPACRSCLSTRQEWVQVSGKGTLHTFSVIHVGPKAFMQDGPYVWAFAKLVESPRPIIVMGNLVGCEHAAIRIDMPLRIEYHDVPGHDMTLYHFRAEQA
ncbi:MAG TPA: OB-fold domain-containing protein [Ramlibacter sp.]|nr:OB-fold domain-containing protein [Ramlibacter sp.]